MTEADKKTSGKRLQGTVLKISNNKTLTVRMEIKKSHPMYGRVVKSHKNYLVHNDLENIAVGDLVMIEESKPISKLKKFVLVKKVSK